MSSCPGTTASMTKALAKRYMSSLIYVRGIIHASFSVLAAFNDNVLEVAFAAEFSSLGIVVSQRLCQIAAAYASRMVILNREY